MKQIKQGYKWIKNRYTILAVAVLLTLIVVLMLSGEFIKGASDAFSEDLVSHSKIFSISVSSFFEKHMSDLEDISSALGRDVLENPDHTKEILEGRSQEFATYVLFRKTGEKAFDCSNVPMILDLSENDVLSTLVKDKKSALFNGVVQDDNHETYISFLTPVLHDGNVLGILMGAVPVKDLSSLMKKWEKTEDGFAFMVTDRGVYVAGGGGMEKTLLSQGNDFLTYLSTCEMKRNTLNAVQIEIMIKHQKEVLAHYTRSGKDYVLVLLPEYRSEWCTGYLLEEPTYGKEFFHLSGFTAFLLFLSITLWILIIIYGGCLLYKYGKSREQMARYEIISKMDKAIVFEMNFSPKKLDFYGDVSSFPSLNFKKLSGEGIYDIYDLIHPDDRSVRKRLHEFYEGTDEIFTAEVRVKMDADRYGWFRVTSTLIRAEHSKINLKMIGKIENADTEIADEKNLVERAENDLLTGILNKKTMEERVTKSLEELSGRSCRIFFMVDLDNFKNVNDRLGHIMGDKAITDTADVLSEIFHSDAYVGRLGGDEFAVCVMYDAFDEQSLYEYIRKKAEKVCEANRRVYSNGTEEIAISSSVGIAVAPEMATDFETLYKKADSALYKSKNGGKNCYHIFGK